MKSGVKTVLDKTGDLKKAMRLLTDQEVVAGIPADKAARDEDGPVTNAQLGFIHENGSPKRNIPARPFRDPGIRAGQDQIEDQLRAAGKAALEGDARGVTTALNRAGLIAQNSIRAQFVDNDWPPLDPKTLKRRPPAVRDESGEIVHKGKSREERGAVNPLVDTSQLRKSVTYAVRKRSR